MNRRQAGQLGGLQRALRYNHSQLSEWSKKGGRRRALTIADFAPAPIMKKEEAIEHLSLEKLRELWRIRVETVGTIQERGELGQGKCTVALPGKECD